MSWIYHDDNIFNLNRFAVISRVGDYDISLSQGISPDDEEYQVLCFESNDQREIAFSTLKIPWSKNRMDFYALSSLFVCKALTIVSRSLATFCCALMPGS